MKWCKIEWIDIETGEILNTKDMKLRNYRLIKEECVKQQFYHTWYKKIIRYVKITAIQKKLEL